MTSAHRPSLLLLAETLVMLIMASLAVRLVSFARLARILLRQRESGREAPIMVATSIRRALEAWNRRLPWRTLCFEQGLSAHWMLHRRGLASTLNYGAAQVDGELAAHVWVRSGTVDVVGCDHATDFVSLSQFSNGPSS